MVKFILYLIRWQLSTPILAPIVAYFKHSESMFGTKEDWIAATIANLIGGCIFFWVDRFIFKSKAVEKWEILKYGPCHDCGHNGLLKRLVAAPGYDKTNDANPEYRCKECSEKKLESLIKEKKVKI
jgi:DNA-directed RNA polymerase subunit RPC12/RpoP